MAEELNSARSPLPETPPQLGATITANAQEHPSWRNYGGPIPLNEAQEQEAKDWAADDRLWTTQETVEFNLRTFARAILKHSPRPIGEELVDRPQPMALPETPQAPPDSKLLSWAARLVRAVCSPELVRDLDEEVAEPVRRIAMEMKAAALRETPPPQREKL